MESVGKALESSVRDWDGNSAQVSQPWNFRAQRKITCW